MNRTSRLTPLAVRTRQATGPVTKGRSSARMLTQNCRRVPPRRTHGTVMHQETPASAERDLATTESASPPRRGTTERLEIRSDAGIDRTSKSNGSGRGLTGRWSGLGRADPPSRDPGPGADLGETAPTVR